MTQKRLLIKSLRTLKFQRPLKFHCQTRDFTTTKRLVQEFEQDFSVYTKLYRFFCISEISPHTGSLTPGIKNQICLRLSPIEKWAFFMKKSCQFFKIYIASFCVLCYNIVIYAYPEVPHESQNQQVQTRSSLLHH